MNKIIGSVLIVLAIIVSIMLFFYVRKTKAYKGEFFDFILDFWEIFGAIFVLFMLGIVYLKEI